ncbi:hypothetical protein [Leucobacter aridicollis]|uniref:Uncharacterized protein n=1 Tax=Leucobacter aridicollis TaxID=283878 RepID=A0A852RC61_9MICO|nr:hypothetical protein [Leucobacter aridicollis]MBL3681988.1 hypothetical protein [Leucobacter aridicollis]NYD26966.1 hypothetical protein [Leucobacter aridicollis]
MNANTPSKTDIFGGIDYLRNLISDVAIGVILENGRGNDFDFDCPVAQMTDEELTNVSEKLDEMRGQLEWRDLEVPCYDGIDDVVDHVDDGVDCEPEHWKSALEAFDLDSARVDRFVRVRRELCEKHGLQPLLAA